jgi:hypothetical protein
MGIGKIGLAASAVVLLAAAGCQSERISRVDTRPTPLPAAPAGNVTASQLPPPPAPASFPETPPPAPATQVAAIDPNAGAAPSAPVTEGGVAGVWNVSVGGQSCRVATPRTKFGQGYRAAPLRCPAPLDGVKSWAVQGSQMILYNESGSQVASLSSSGPEKFNGTTSSGSPVSLSR